MYFNLSNIGCQTHDPWWATKKDGDLTGMCVEVCISQSRFRPINKICPLNPDLAIKPKAQITLLSALSNKGELLMEITFRSGVIP